jgi:hypothetical protein
MENHKDPHLAILPLPRITVPEQRAKSSPKQLELGDENTQIARQHFKSRGQAT